MAGCGFFLLLGCGDLTAVRRWLYAVHLQETPPAPGRRLHLAMQVPPVGAMAPPHAAGAAHRHAFSKYASFQMAGEAYPTRAGKSTGECFVAGQLFIAPPVAGAPAREKCGVEVFAVNFAVLMAR